MSEERLDRLADLWVREFSTVEISQKLGIPHGSVCRLARNARLRGDERFKVRQPPVTKKPQSDADTTVPAPKLAPIPISPEYHTPGPHIFELKPRECRYPMTSGPSARHRFCARRQREGSPYCAEHHERCNSKPVARVRR